MRRRILAMPTNRICTATSTSSQACRPERSSRRRAIRVRSALPRRDHFSKTLLGKPIMMERMNTTQSRTAQSLYPAVRYNDANGKSPSTLGGVTAAVYIALDSREEIDTLHGRVKAAGGDVIRELSDTDYGSHDFAVRDPEGHIWSFGTYKPQAG